MLLDLIISYKLVKFNRRLVFDISWQHPNTIYQGPDDGDYFKFKASNGYEVFSRSRMDIQTERIWVLGAKAGIDDRAGTMVFDNNQKRDAAFEGITQALDEWAKFYGGIAINV